MKCKGASGNMHDAWFLNVNETIHAFHLQLPKNNLGLVPEVGHVKTTDLLHWEQRPSILPALYGEDETDYHEKFTGCAYTIPAGLNGNTKEQYLVYYTMRDQEKASQRIGAAVSEDLISFERHPENPFLIPEAAGCISFDNIEQAQWNIVDCRDLVVAEKDGVYYGYFAAAARVGRNCPSGVIVCAISNDLIHWKDQRIVYIPKQNGVIEVPDVFEIDGKWYLTFLNGVHYRGRSCAKDENVLNCTSYAVADHPLGPFAEPEDSLYIGGKPQSGYTCRTVLFKGKRYLLYVDRADEGNQISLPKEVQVKNGRLCVCYTSLLEKIRKKRLNPQEIGTLKYIPNSFAWETYGGEYRVEENQITAVSEAEDYQVVYSNPVGKNLELSCMLQVNAVGAGIALSAGCDSENRREYILSFEPQREQILLMNNIHFTKLDGRQYRFLKEENHIRILWVDGVIEVYINGELIMQGGLAQQEQNQMGFFIDRGNAKWSQIEAYELEA